MRAALFSLLVLAFGATAPGFAQSAELLGSPPEAGERLGSGDFARLLQRVAKPAKPGVTAPVGDDSCRFANDRECDEPGVGTGACRAGTDHSDCWRIMTGREDDSCRWSNDGECDEPRFGTGACTQGTDLSDCGDVSHLRFRNDTCDTAFDGVCNEPGLGDGTCEERTDRADCAGRDRPATINDHFFGRDDRVLMDTGEFPWSVVGYVTFEAGGTCTATLVAPDVLVTASHCVHDDGRLAPAGQFTTGEDLPGGPRTARVIDHLIDPDWDGARFSETDQADGTDWALLRIDRRLGDELGHVGALDLVRARGEAGARRARIWQAGYSWDTGDSLSGNTDCRILTVYDDDTMAHDCDTTRGDSGSPFMVEADGDWFVVATDSNFRSNPDGPFIYIAARSEAWIDYLDDFAAGRIGAGGLRPAGPGKPGAPVTRKPPRSGD
ncbi:peptidase S1 [Marinicauda salina]|uniref:Serine protease n=1 Tax=Marinicauda salina TaxID=2135793 RepID=A0A2U2BX96_9PROT|nr:trypsin-like serine protease [Marinicauda salina]PWE18632.1 peptidase S1 [Marinicauda salina]